MEALFSWADIMISIGYSGSFFHLSFTGIVPRIVAYMEQSYIHSNAQGDIELKYFKYSWRKGTSNTYTDIEKEGERESIGARKNAEQ